jgi:hypothetical protein
MKDLTYNRTLNVASFAAETKATKLDLVENPKTGKLFFVTDISTVSGKVSNTFDSTKDIRISHCTDTESNDSFWMLHNPGESPNVKATFSLI